MKFWKPSWDFCVFLMFFLSYLESLTYPLDVLWKRFAWEFLKDSPFVFNRKTTYRVGPFSHTHIYTVWKIQMTAVMYNHPAASHFFCVVLLSAMAVEGAERSKAVEFEFGVSMSHLRSVREMYEEGKHFFFLWRLDQNTQTFTQRVASISAGSRTSPDRQCKRELLHTFTQIRTCSDVCWIKTCVWLWRECLVSRQYNVMILIHVETIFSQYPVLCCTAKWELSVVA